MIPTTFERFQKGAVGNRRDEFRHITGWGTSAKVDNAFLFQLACILEMTSDASTFSLI